MKLLLSVWLALYNCFNFVRSNQKSFIWATVKCHISRDYLLCYRKDSSLSLMRFLRPYVCSWRKHVQQSPQSEEQSSCQPHPVACPLARESIGGMNAGYTFWVACVLWCNVLLNCNFFSSSSSLTSIMFLISLRTFTPWLLASSLTFTQKNDSTSFRQKECMSQREWRTPREQGSLNQQDQFTHRDLGSISRVCTGLY